MEWTKERVIAKIKEISEKGFIPIPAGTYRKDDGIIGQVLEREFGVPENNIHLADLGTYELKGMRLSKKKTRKLTLFHQTSTSGMTPTEIFERFSYERPSRRDGSPMRKLFTAIKGNRKNNLGFTLKVSGEAAVELYHQEEYLATWDLAGSEGKNQSDPIGDGRNNRESQFKRRAISFYKSIYPEFAKKYLRSHHERRGGYGVVYRSTCG